MTDPGTATVRRYCGVCDEEHDLPWGVCLYAEYHRLVEAAREFEKRIEAAGKHRGYCLACGTRYVGEHTPTCEREALVNALPAPPGEEESDG
jgi:hypothetical protein